MDNKIWEQLGPYTCRLDVDEAQSIEQVWIDISKQIDLPVDVVKKSIEPIKELFVILDHTRTALIIIQDGGLPSNAGGGSNLRNIIRRVFAIMKKNGWWEKIGKLEGFLKLFDEHKNDLEQIFGKFAEYKSFGDIIRIEYERWAFTESGHKKKLEQLLTKSKGKLTLDQWIMAMESWGIPADAISEVAKCSPPDNLYS
jgi:alanyl-tRNA synthetase